MTGHVNEPVSCSSCGAPMLWAVTERGKRMPVDAEPVESGKFLLSHRRVGDPPVAVYQRGPDIAKLRAQHERRSKDQGALFGEGPLRLFTSHFATCPNADQHRKRQPQRQETQR